MIIPVTGFFIYHHQKKNVAFTETKKLGVLSNGREIGPASDIIE
ncbi:hypothetical protein [Carnobacterium maltaromaticum]|nr:hypothetical protein [Carnobacterium maltaromaticum]